ncbi:MAG: hypothetical protein FVQ81_13090 [Candidatus Glassbacteria bacterium]|nr:hypothetical protein [Candidatus Glassbacteria bacterium]
MDSQSLILREYRLDSEPVFAGKKPVRFQPTPEIDGQIRRLYQGPRKKGDIASLAKRIGWNTWNVNRRAGLLGVVIPRKKEPPWNDGELRILERNGHLHPSVIQKRLKAKGFHRSEIGIVLKRKRMRLTAPNLDHGFAANVVSLGFGVDRNTVIHWIEKGWLKASRRGWQGDSNRDGWWITRRQVRRFIKTRLDCIDFGKVDKWWLVDILEKW